MQSNTISDIIAANTANLPEKDDTTLTFEKKIIGWYDETISEKMYDTDEICTKLCGRFFDDEYEDDPSDVEACRIIYDIFYICKKHVATINFEHDLRVAHELEGQRIKNRMSGYIINRAS